MILTLLVWAALASIIILLGFALLWLVLWLWNLGKEDDF